MNTLGIIGNPVQHSRSPEIYKKFFVKDALNNWQYKIFELEEISQLPNLIQNTPHLKGFNVTIPFKTSIIPYLNHVQQEATEIGAVNTVTVKPDKNGFQLHGYNTDVAGFEKALEKAFGLVHEKALILGTGGSSRAVTYVLKKLGIPFSMVSRQTGYNYTYADLDENILQNHRLIINTTPVGMDIGHDFAPEIPYRFLTRKHCCFDLVYTPEFTGFIKACLPYGAKTCNGSDMLQFQAEISWDIFKQDSLLLNE